MRKFFLSFWETLEIVFISAGTVFLIRSFLVQPFLVSGASMEPNFQNGNYLIIDEVTYRFRDPERGEVVVFRYPDDERVFFIKRIVGLPGERLVSKKGRITVFPAGGGDGYALDEAYLGETASEGTDDFEVRLRDDEYFVLGDNRLFSFDSRKWGPVRRREVVGLVRLRVFPLGSFTSIAPPIYQESAK